MKPDVSMPVRMWINQPSTLQPHHALHGKCVMATREYGDTYRVYFLSGEVVSQQLPESALSIGWPQNASRTPRQKFEVWARDRAFELRTDRNGQYEQPFTCEAWEIWSAAISATLE